MRYKLGHANLVDVGVVAEGAINVLHVGAAACEDDAAKKLVGVLVGHLAPYVLHNLLHAGFHDVDELALLHAAVVVDGIGLARVDLVGVGVGRGVVDLHLLGVLLLHLQRCDVLGDVVASQGNDGEVAQNLLVEHGHCCGVGSQVDQYASAALLGLGEHAVGQSQGRQVHLCDGDACVVEAFVDVAVESLAPKDIDEVALDA